MELKEYLKNNELSMTKFSELVECNQSYISLICQKKRRPSPELALKIEQTTNGEVRVMELLYPAEKEQKPKAA